VGGAYGLCCVLLDLVLCTTRSMSYNVVFGFSMDDLAEISDEHD